ncbi:hypothetical protein SSCG_05145 [Streptomyces clavuligerus]|nr:hypothetical protein SSCG_05145 [Streptomyces clavuligerus]
MADRLLRGGRPDAAARRRCRRPGRDAPAGADGRRRDRVRRRPGAAGRRPPDEGEHMITRMDPPRAGERAAGPVRAKGFVTAGRRIAVPLRRASLLTGLGLLIALAAASAATLSLGRLGIPLAELGGALGGGAEGKDAFVLERLRGPRLVVALGTGCALGLSGALFQSATRNPLGSPDVNRLGAGNRAIATVYIW